MVLKVELGVWGFPEEIIKNFSVGISRCGKY